MFERKGFIGLVFGGRARNYTFCSPSLGASTLSEDPLEAWPCLAIRDSCRGTHPSRLLTDVGARAEKLAQ